jgi:mannose-6-phosphate isomerase
MTIEHAHAHLLPKIWGVADLRPWSNAADTGATIGELWYERSDPATASPSLLLKLLLTRQPLSIQVHPDDAYAESIGLPNGKTEAWYILRAAPEAKIALGLRQRISSAQLRLAIEDGSIADLVDWRPAHTGDTTSVAAGTIHAIGAGLVIAEIQQRSDATFRLFDYGRGRELHVENALAVSDAGPAALGATAARLTDTRAILISNTHFTFERIDLAPNSSWSLEAKYETWLLVIDGGGRAGSFDVATGDAIFAQSDRFDILADTHGLVALVAYTGGVLPQMLECVDRKTVQ